MSFEYFTTITPEGEETKILLNTELFEAALEDKANGIVLMFSSSGKTVPVKGSLIGVKGKLDN